MIELVVFDLDGTLIDTSADITASVNAALRALGLAEQPLERVLPLIGDGARRLIERALPVEARVRAGEALELYRRHYRDHILDRTVPYPGIIGLLDDLEPLALAICTNKPGELLRPIVTGLGWESRFELVLGGDELPRQKPDPLPLVTVCERLGVMPSRALMVGDGPQDAGAARAAGLAWCAVHWGFTPIDELRKLNPDYEARQPADVVAFVGGRP